MMNNRQHTASDLIEIRQHEIGEAMTLTVNARELWAFVESKQDFSTWIKGRIQKYGLTQGIDFIAPQNYGAPKSTTYAQERIDYFLTIDTAKELAMVENNVKGREVRRYFIECERRAKTQQQQQQQPAYYIPPTYQDALRLAADLVVKTEEQGKLIEAQQPKVAFYDDDVGEAGKFSK